MSWPELLVLLLVAASASVWRWREGVPGWAPLPELFGALLGFFVPALAVGRLLDQTDRRFGLGLVAAGALLSRLAAVGSPFLSFLSFAGGMAALFWTEGTCFLLLLPLAGWAGPALGGGPALAALLSGTVMTVFCRRARRGRDLMLAGLGTGLAGAVGAATLGGEAGAVGLGAAFLAGPASALLIWALLPLAERAVDRTSPLSLVELLNPSHPLLERLRHEAPGTYYHSRDVAALAEAAARAVGADPLLAAVGGLYHDIGKLLRPHFFAENQNGTNPHEGLAPSMSKVVLASHVKDGVELGRQYGLRGDVLRFVATHHGTSVMRYFSSQGAAQGLSEDEFRYDAPLPNTAETAIVMLADSVEAYSRGAERQDLGELVDMVIEDRRRDGQLDRCPLTFAALARIRRAFLEVLQGMAHRRAKDYPPLG
ncbi:HDIG domain-containing protein [Candidatus Bipolaricaulota bacterium]|nr:HDIG domain-containing protein [Candidatus Bipolaricaulota bacterium]